MVDMARAERLIAVLTEIVDWPLCNDSERVELSATLVGTSLELAGSVRTLCADNLLLGATVCLRTQFESLVRSVWAMHCASEHQIERLSTDQLNAETVQGAKHLPTVTKMLEEMQRVTNLASLMIALNEFKQSALAQLNSFVHAGLHAVIRTKFGWPAALIDQTFRISNSLCVLCFIHIGLLTGRSDVQSELTAATASFSSVLPKRR